MDYTELDQQILDLLAQEKTWDEVKAGINQPSNVIAARLDYLTLNNLIKVRVVYAANN